MLGEDSNAYSSINSPLNLHLLFRDENSNLI